MALFSLVPGVPGYSEMVIGPLGLNLIACCACDVTGVVTMSCEVKLGVKGVWDDVSDRAGVRGTLDLVKGYILVGYTFS